MTNFEKYTDQLKEFFSERIGISKYDGKFKNCNSLDCTECMFDNFGECSISAKRKWIDEEYVEPQVDWTKVPVDTPILVMDNPDEEWRRRYFAKYENGMVHAFEGGKTSWSDNTGNAVYWNYAKLAEQE